MATLFGTIEVPVLIEVGLASTVVGLLITVAILASKIHKLKSERYDVFAPDTSDDRGD